METGKLLEAKKDDILRTADKHDFLVKMDQGRSLLDLSNLGFFAI
jgi:hypothetical protein